MRSWTIAFLCGIVSLNFFAQLPSPLWLLAPLIIALLFAYFTPSPYTKLFQLTIAFTLGFLWVLIFAQWQATTTLPEHWQGKKLTAVGVIASLPEKQTLNKYLKYTKFNFDISQLRFGNQNIKHPIRVRLSWYNRYPKNLKVGDEWQLQIRLKRPHGYANPGSFNFEKWAFSHRIEALGYVLNKGNNHLIASHYYSHPIDRIREYINQQIEKQLGNQPLSGLIRALTLGVRDGINPSAWQVLRSTGTSHLMAISGLHIGLIAGFFYFLVGFLWRRSARLVLLLAAPQAAAIGALFGALLYSAMAGFSLPTQRALIMISVFMFTVLMRRQIQPWNTICLALLGVLIFDPFATLSAGFWLSFAAVSIIIYGVSNRVQAKSLWWRWGRVQWVVTLGLIPLTLLFFQQTSVASFGANLIAIPWVGFLIVPLSLTGSLLLLINAKLGGIILLLTLKLLGWLWFLLTWMTSIHAILWQTHIPSTVVFLFAIIGVILLLAPRGFPRRWLGLFFLLPLMIPKPFAPSYGDAWFTLLDVGQGLSAIVRTQHHLLVYDTGAKFSPNFDTGQSVVAPFLRTQGIQKIDRMVISHGDNDHIGGSASLLKAFPVTQIQTSAPQRFNKTKAKKCLQGEHWNWDGVKFRFLYPSNKMLNSDNNSSCVLQVTVGNHHILLTGDIEKAAENYLVNHEANLLSSEILIAPHHGSRTSSTQAFIQAVDPQYVLFPIGFRNRYRFPHQSVLKRYQNNNTTLFDTAQSGAISFKIIRNEPLVIPEIYRKKQQRFWMAKVDNKMVGGKNVH